MLRVLVIRVARAVWRRQIKLLVGRYVKELRWALPMFRMPSHLVRPRTKLQLVRIPVWRGKLRGISQFS